MYALLLNSPVTIGGREAPPQQRNFWGGESKLTIRPTKHLDDLGWYWEVAGELVPITPALFHHHWRWVELRYGKHRFREFEHIAFLYALGVRGIVIQLEGSSWPPYLCSRELWRLVQNNLFRSRVELMPLELDATNVLHEGRPAKFRSIICGPNIDGKSLRIGAEVDYGFGKNADATFDCTRQSVETTIEQVASARSLARPNFLWPLALVASRVDICGWTWPHIDRLLWWGDRGEKGTKFWAELARHKILDAMLLAFLAEPNKHLCGIVSICRSNHKMDLRLLRSLVAQREVAQARGTMRRAA